MEIVVDFYGEKACFDAPPVLSKNFIREIHRKFDTRKGNLYDDCGKNVFLGDDMVSREYTLKLPKSDYAIMKLKELGIEIYQESLYNENKDPYIIELLLDTGMIFIDNEVYTTVLHKNLEVLKILIEKGLDIYHIYEDQNDENVVLLLDLLYNLEFYGKNEDYKNKIKYLIDIHEDINHKIYDRLDYPIFYCNEHLDILEKLIDKGANIYARNINNETVLTSYEEGECLDYILSHDKKDILGDMFQLSVYR